MGLVLESAILELVTVLAVVCSFVYYYFTNAYGYWKKKGVPFFPPSIPFGNFKDVMLMRVSQAEGFQKFYNEAKGLPYVGLYQIRKPWLLVRDPQLIKHILVKDFTHFHDRGISFDEEREPLSQHLLNLGGPKWRGLRAKLTPTFTSGKMKMMFSLISGCAEELGKFLESPAQHGESLEMREIMAKFTTDVIGTCAFGLQFNSMKDPDSEFRAMGRKVFQFTAWKNIKRTMRSLAPSLLRLLNLKVMDDDVEQFFINAVKETINYREENGITRNDFLQLLIQLKHKGKVQEDDEMDSSEDAGSKKHIPNGIHKEDHIEFTDNLLSAQAFIFFLAGFETSSTTLSFCLYELALNPDVQAKLRKEINTTLQQAGGISYDCIQDMTYLSKVVDETLRKYPPGANLIRIVTKPYTVPDTSVHLEKGRNVVIPVYGLHHDSEYFPNPEQFNPENFNDEAKAKRPHYAYLPFGEGPRNCIGLRFGLLQVKVGLAVLLSNFQFSTCEKTRVPLKLDPKQFIPTPIGGVWIRINKLEQA